MKITNLKELRDALNQFSEEDLEQSESLVTNEESYTRIDFVNQLTEDHYVDDEGVAYPISQFDHEYESSAGITIDDYRIIKKGYITLDSDF